jgi:hypothetical protein
MLRDSINDALKDAMRDQDRRRVCTLRLMNAAIKDRDIAARADGRDRVSDPVVLEILSKMIKQREESARLYEEGGRLELAEQEREEMQVIRSFLPKQLSDDEVESACRSTIREIGATGLRDMGKAMNTLKSRYPGQMDFQHASSVVKDILR